MTSSSSTPDISALSLTSQPSQQRLHDTYEYEGGGNGKSPYHYSTSPAIPAQSQYNPLGMGQSPLKNRPVLRGGLPSQWLDNSMADNRSLSPHNNSDLSSSGGSPPPAGSIVPPVTPGTPNPGADDEIIPTAIVIKNIPFNVKRETLLDIIASLSIPTPYAFNYHLDQSGQFRGLAFANFRQAVDADAVVAALNGFDVQGRKLRVEYKKVLQAGEKERIEREKAIRRMKSMQLEKEREQQQAVLVQQQVQTPYEDYGSLVASPFSPQRSFSASSVYQNQQPFSPSQLSSLPTPQSFNVGTPSLQAPVTPSGLKSPTTELDLNDPSTLEIYSRILLFKDDHMRDELAFSRTLTPKQRRVVHLVAQKLGVYHYSLGEGEERYAVVTRFDPNAQQSAGPRHTLTRAPSAYLSPTSPQAPSSLRVKKSMPDMKSLQASAPRLTSRASNGNIREGYATIASPSRRSPGPFAALFGNGGAFGPNGIPPVPSLPSALESPGGVVRQPRGPGTGGFESRRERRESQTGRGFEARSHEPLEI
ncbi:hypothetical protein WOLCODRAFT_161766 [Wolfiporia cocos MD-104 SS10]|uniref:RRM domain-containing protein n=1 Tax=Wolfiporia cocos (strain MD-104) TaxID=742152 RepID=A0A2H3JLV4_WOLCO|nr:hypothetical protein WOLCODRAFT_161766 [Wolfiporia cocos MD-104 SS10]